MSNTYRFNGNILHSAGEMRVRVSQLDSLEGEVFLEPLIFMASQCCGFKTLEEHAEEQWKRISLKNRMGLVSDVAKLYSFFFQDLILGPRCFIKMLAGIFEKFSELGIFVSDSHFIQILEAQASKVDRPPSISSLGMITCNRPKNLKKCLESYIGNLKLHFRKVDVVVCDDSKTVEMREENKKVILEVQKELDYPVLYAGLEEKIRFSEELQKLDVPKQVADFALFDLANSNYSYGANCNAFYLHTAGELTFVTDDDTLCNIARSPSYEDGLCFNENSKSFDLWFYKNRQDVLELNQWESRDLLGMHELLLGKTLAQVAQEEVQQRSLSGLKLDSILPHEFLELLDGEGRILLTHNSLAGDTGSNSPAPFLFAKGEQLKRMTKNREAYEDVFYSREQVKACRYHQIKRASVCMSTFYGADNRNAIPPFFPYFRNCDALFGEMFQYCGRGNYFAYLPWTLLHAPPDERFYSKKDLFAVHQFTLEPELLIRSLFQMYGPKHGVLMDSEKALMRAGTFLLDYSTLPISEFKRHVFENFKLTQATSIQKHEELLRDSKNSPDYMREDIQKIIHFLKKMPVSAIPKDDSLFESRLNMIQNFAHLLMNWPKMHLASRKLKDNGIRMAQILS